MRRVKIIGGLAAAIIVSAFDVMSRSDRRTYVSFEMSRNLLVIDAQRTEWVPVARVYFDDAVLTVTRTASGVTASVEAKGKAIELAVPQAERWNQIVAALEAAVDETRNQISGGKQ